MAVGSGILMSYVYDRDPGIKKMLEFVKVKLPDSSSSVPQQVAELWRQVFGECEVQYTRGRFCGDELGFHDDVLYAVLKDGEIAACCHITSQKNGRIAGLGGVASAPEFRGQGMADKLLDFALQDFDQSGCDTIFLGTGNPAAANLYAKYGFAFLRGTAVMMRTAGGARPMDILRRELSLDGETGIKSGDASLRLPIIPLACCGCSMLVGDGVAGIFGADHLMQRSCMGLYMRYEGVRRDGGDFLMLRSGTHILGTASFVPVADAPEQVKADLLYTAEAAEYAPELLKQLQRSAGGRALDIAVSPQDAAKYEMLLSCGAGKTGSGKLTPVAGVEIPVDILRVAAARR